MAYHNSASERLDELRYRKGQTSRHGSSNESSLLGLVSPPRNGNRMPQQSLSAQDARASLTRRFTTESGRVPTLQSVISPGRPAQDTQEYGPSTYHKVQLLEKKKLEYEKLREQRRRFESEMQLLDLQQRREEQELAQMQEDLGTMGRNGGATAQSEPTTPPEFSDSNSGFPSAFSRPNRYSTSSLISPPGLYNRSNRSGSQITSPQSGFLSQLMMDNDKLPSRSSPASRRNSEEDDKEQAVRQDPTSHRSTNALNRYSMPVTRSRNGMHEMLSLDQTNTARFLFGEEDSIPSAPDKNYHYAMDATEDKFPILVRREEYPGVLSASSAALDLALSQSPGPEQTSNGWGSSSFAPRHRSTHSQQSISTNMQGHPQTSSNNHDTQPSMDGRTSYRHSLDLKYYGESQDPPSHLPPTAKQPQAAPPKLQSSYSANDIPSMRSTPAAASNVNATGMPNSHAQQHLHNHNASLGRIPLNAMNNRLSREIIPSESSNSREATVATFQSLQTALSGNAAPFGPSQHTMLNGIVPPPTTFAAMPGYYNPSAYNMQLMNTGMQNMQIGSPTMYSPNNPYVDYGTPFQPAIQGRDSQQRIMQQRRQGDGDAMSRFTNTTLEQLGGEIYSLCKDQHGCRFLQKKLEERNPDQIHLIWLETNEHVIELMTDPFGNYLCQKLLEFCNDGERTVLVQNASHDLVRIALNQHGTRALQKMIEFLSTPQQIQIVIQALRYRVVELIQDLNGNHVIQKCLNKLSAENAQFIFDSVGQHCVDVGTHRHGCCVLQRCIDHASGDQKAWLIRQITNNAFHLVQDPFGNYVVQYILDLNEPIFTEPLIGTFRGHVGHLSKQKFSSNVIEKCIRCAQEPSKEMLIDEMLQPVELDRLLRDSFANYVIQTALDYATPSTRARLVDAIRPHLPAIRTTPYGRRIQAKIQGDGRSGPSSGQITPKEMDVPTAAPFRHQRGPSGVANGPITSIFTPGMGNNMSASSSGFTSPSGSAHVTSPMHPNTGYPDSSDRAFSPQGPGGYAYPNSMNNPMNNRAMNSGYSGGGNWL